MPMELAPLNCTIPTLFPVRRTPQPLLYTQFPRKLVKPHYHQTLTIRRTQPPEVLKRWKFHSPFEMPRVCCCSSGRCAHTCCVLCRGTVKWE